MSNIALEIGGRSYTVACQDGQEPHIAGLGRSIDAKLASLGPNVRQNEARTLLFAALLLADEIHELKNARGAAAAAAAPGVAQVTAPQLEAFAERLEKLAESLEG